MMDGNETNLYAIGIDVGGTKIAGGIVDLVTGQILARRVTPTLAHRGGQAVLDDTYALAHKLLLDAGAVGQVVSGIGLGVPELVDLAGAITSAYNFDWRTLPVQATLAELAPVVVEADVRAAALAEARFGAGRDYRLFCYVTVGTGISCCLVQARRPYAGAHGNALILASSPLTTTCMECGAELKPVLEEFASGPALVARYNAAVDHPLLDGKAVLAAVTLGDRTAANVVHSAGAALGVSVGWLVNVLDPEAIIVGGGLGSAEGLYWESFVESTREHIWSESHRNLPINHAALGPDAGVVGAAAAALPRDE